MKKHVCAFLLSFSIALFSNNFLYAFSLTPEHIDGIKNAADKGNAVAQVVVGLLYEGGELVEQDYQKARLWYEKAAQQDDASAYFRLGLLYDNGYGVQKDQDQAKKFFESACTKGLQEGCDAYTRLNTQH